MTANGTNLLPLVIAGGGGAQLLTHVGQPVTATAVPVQSVPANEGFWIGPSADQRLWVQLTGTGESPVTVKQGDKVTFQGTVVANTPEFIQQAGLPGNQGANQLTQQGFHIEVPKTGISAAG